MNRMKQLLHTAVFGLFSLTAAAQGWIKIGNLPSTEFSALEVIDGRIYTVSGKKLFVSADNGQTWSQSVFTNQNNVRVSCLKKFGNKIYAGTSKGIFSADISAVGNIWSQDTNSFEVNSFTEKDGTLYSSQEVYGVLRLIDDTWTAFSTGIPNYSGSVTEVLDTPAGLLAIAGANGTFYRYDFTKNIWIEDYYVKNTISAGLYFDDLIVAGNSLYASQYRRIMRSDDLGETWVEDKQGLVKGISRFMYCGKDTLYSISSTYTNGTMINKRSIENTGASWATDVQVLPFFTNAMRQYGEHLFIAANNGVYTTMDVLGTPPQAKIDEIKIYPNPSEGLFAITGQTAVNKLEIYDMSGRIVLTEENPNGITDFSITNEGIYIARMITGETSKTQKIIVRK